MIILYTDNFNETTQSYSDIILAKNIIALNEKRGGRSSDILIGFDVRNTYLTAMKTDPYFKVYNCVIGSKATKQARIAFSRGEYVHHKGGLPEALLDSDTKKKMIKYFKSGGWEETLEDFNEVIRQLSGDYSYNFYCDMPDYSVLECKGGFTNR